MSGTVVSEGNTITAGANVTITTTIVKNEYRCSSRSEPFPGRRQSTALRRRSVASKSPQNAECVSDLARSAAEKLQESAKCLSEQLEKPLAPPAEYVSLVKTLEGICRSTVPAIATTLSGECEADSLLWRKLLDIVSYMQKVAENTTLARELSFQGLIGKLNHPRDIWSLFLTVFTLAYWMACERRLLTAVNQELEGLRLAANSILLELSMSLPKDPPVDLITFQDFFGARWHLSRDFCLDRDIFQNVLHARFRNGPAEYFVVTGQFIVFDQATAKAIGLSSWSGAIASGQELQLSVVVNRPKVTKTKCIECPRCSRQVVYLRDASEWVDCHQCGASFSVRAAEQGPDGEYQVTSPASGDDFASANRSSGFKFYSIRTTQETLESPARSNNSDAPKSEAESDSTIEARGREANKDKNPPVADESAAEDSPTMSRSHRLPRRTKVPSVAELVKKYQDYLPAQGEQELTRTALSPGSVSSESEQESAPPNPRRLPPRSRNRHDAPPQKASTSGQASDFEQSYAANIAPRYLAPSRRPQGATNTRIPGPIASVSAIPSRSQSRRPPPTMTGNKVSTMSKHFEPLGKDAERSKSRYAVIRGKRARPVASARAKVEILDSVKDAIWDDESESSDSSSEADDEGEGIEEDRPRAAPEPTPVSLEISAKPPDLLASESTKGILDYVISRRFKGFFARNVPK